VTARFAGCARERVVIVVGLFVKPGLYAANHPLASVAVDVQVLPELLVADSGRVERRLTVFEVAPCRPRLSQFGQFAVPALHSTPIAPFHVSSQP